MRTIIAGSRTIWDYNLVDQAVTDSGFTVSTVVCGMARGVDSVGWAIAYVNGIRVDERPADWGIYGKRAGYLRNLEMANNADALIAVWDGVSRGTEHMIDIALELNLKVYVHRVPITAGL